MPSSTGRPARPPQIGAAPGELELVRAFVNTRNIEAATDDLAAAAGLQDWLAGAGLMTSATAPVGPTRAASAGRTASPGRTASAGGASSADLERAVALRESLRGILRAHVAASGGHASDGLGENASDLRRLAAALPVRLEVSDDGRITPGPAGSGPTAALARLLLIAAESAALGSWPRLKVCSAAACQVAFYDRSPTQNACWCSMQICGARAKSRAYRQRGGSSPRRRRAADSPSIA